MNPLHMNPALTTLLCFPRLPFSPSLSALPLCLRCVCFGVCGLWISSFNPFYPTPPALCFVRIPMLLYLTFWTTQGPEIEPQWHRRSPTGQTAASAVETVAVHTHTHRTHTWVRACSPLNIQSVMALLTLKVKTCQSNLKLFKYTYSVPRIWWKLSRL